MADTVRIRTIAFAAAISVIVGLVHIYPDLKFIRSMGAGYKGIGFNATQDAAIYLGRINSVYKGGDKTIPSIDIYEHRHDLWSLPFLGELFLGTVGSFLRIPLSVFKIIFSFILPVIVYWMIYWLALLLCASMPAAVLSAMAATLGYSFFTNDPMYAYRLMFSREAAIQLWLLRPISPQFNYILLLASWIAFYFLATRRRYVYAVLSGIATGLFWYIGGVYYFSYFLAFLALYFCYLLFKRDRPQAVKVILVLATAAVVSIPFARNYLELIRLPEYRYMLERLSLIYGRRPIIPLGITAISVFLVWFHYTRRTKAAEFVIFFVLAGLVCLNQQILTARTSQPSHWQNYMVKAFVIIVLFPALSMYLREKRLSLRLMKALRNAAIFALIPLSLLQQDNYYARFRDKFAVMQDLSGAFAWLKAHASGDDVVLNDPMNFVTREIPHQQDFLMYTDNYVYLPSVLNTLVSRDEAEHRYLSALRFFGYGPREAETFFSYWNGIAFRGMVAESSFGGSKMPDEYLRHLKKKYEEFLRQDPLELLERYRIDYVLIGRTSGFFESVDTAYGGIQKVYDDGKFKIYKIRRG